MCDHTKFDAHAHVHRFLDNGVVRFSAEIAIRCAACNLPFRFLGLGQGVSQLHPTVSFSGCEARLPAEPVGESPIKYVVADIAPDGAGAIMTQQPTDTEDDQNGQ